MKVENFLIGFSIALCGNHRLARAQQDFKLSDYNTNDCKGAGENYVLVNTSDECVTAAVALELPYQCNGYWGSYPIYCHIDSGNAYFNRHSIGAGQVNSAPICKYVGKSLIQSVCYVYVFKQSLLTTGHSTSFSRRGSPFLWV